MNINIGIDIPFTYRTIDYMNGRSRRIAQGSKQHKGKVIIWEKLIQKSHGDKNAKGGT